MFDKSAFNAAIEKRGVKITALARAMGISPSTIYKKNERNGDYTVPEIIAFCEFLNLTPQERDRIFFASEVS